MSKDFCFIFNEITRACLHVMATVQENGGKLMMQERGGEFLEKYPYGIERGWDLVHEWGLALVESPSNPSRVPGGNAVYMGSDAGRWGDVVMGHTEDLSGCFYFLGGIASK